MADPIPEGMTELYDADVPRVDLVDKGANGMPFLIAKSDGNAGLFNADYVRGLIAKSEPEPKHEETVTMTGSPAAIAEMIHKAAMRQAPRTPPATVDEALNGPAAAPAEDVTKSDYESIVKAKYNADDLKRMAGNGQAMEDESYPIADEADLDNAIHAVGRGENNSHNAIRRHIIARAKSLGASSEIPDNWAADGSLKKAEAMEKAMETDDSADGMDPTIVLAEPDMEAPGDPSDPGSPAWEAIDAATARKWTSIAARLRAALEVMADREGIEAATADPDDMNNAMDLDDAACAIDYAISVLAPFAVDEQSEADCGADEMEMLGKAIAGLDPANLETVEAFGPVRKAGRTLSAANEAALRAAITSLQQIIASLPAAPAPTEAGMPVTKTANEEPDMATPTPSEDVTAASGQEPAMGSTPAEPKPVAGQAVTDMAKTDATPVEKAPKLASMMPVYNRDGELIGVVDPTEVTQLADGKTSAPAATGDDGDTDGAMTGGMDADGQMAAVQPADDGTTPTDLAPAPADAVGTPADATTADDDGNVTKAATPDVPTTDMLKSSIDALVKAALDERSAEQADLYKGLEDRNRELEELGQALATKATDLEKRLAEVENAPAVMAIASNGAVPPAHMLRGQDRGGNPELSGGALLKAQFRASDDAREQKAIADEMQDKAIAAFAAMQRRQ